MSEPTNSSNPSDAGKAEEQTALFAHLVMQQTNMAMMLMGKTPHPEAGQIPKDLEAARLFIDQLEMLEAKTQGNLNKQESGMLKQALMSLRMAFVEAVDAPAAEKKPASDSGHSSATGSQPAEAAVEPSIEGGNEPAEDKKKFSKKY